MRRYLIIGLILLAGCAGSQKSTYKPEQRYFDRVIPLARRVHQCMKPPHNLQIYIASSSEPNAWIDGDKIYFTEGVFKYQNETLLFITAHEMAHDKLGHLKKAQGLSYAVTGAMLALNVFVPGAGYLNHAVNPAVVNNFTKSQEMDADKLASEVSDKCLGIPIAQQTIIMRTLSLEIEDSGGFWDRHPSWADRIKNVSASAPQP